MSIDSDLMALDELDDARGVLGEAECIGGFDLRWADERTRAIQQTADEGVARNPR